MTGLLQSWLKLKAYAHFAHVNVQGGHFFTLHEQLHDLYSHADEHADEVAERFRQLNPDTVVQMSAPEEIYPAMSDRELIMEAISQLSAIRQQQNVIWANTQATGDYVTNDLMVQLSKYVDFVLWQFNEFLR
jgi:DNA-binding ferritin-like protein